MAEVLSLLYKDILELHRLALRYFQQPRRLSSRKFSRATLTEVVWRQLFDATWKTHKSRFSEVINRLPEHRRLIETQASLIQVRAFQDAQIKADERFSTSEQNEFLRRRHEVNR